MATRNPIVLVDGYFSELPNGDSLIGSGSSVAIKVGVANEGETGKETFDSLGAPKAGDEPVTMVAIHPEFPITQDPGVPFVVGGKTKAGHVLPNACDETGAQILSDAPKQLTGVGYNAAYGAIVAYCDTKGYQSVSVQLLGTWVGTVSFQCSNDSSNWVSVAGYSSAGSLALIASATANGLYTFPCYGRYFRAIITAYTSGTVQSATFLRNQPISTPAPVPAAVTAAVNVSQLNGTAILNPNIAGAMVIGGREAPGTVNPTAYPVYIGGIDAGGRTRRVLTDESGALAGNPTGSFSPLNVQLPQSNNAQDGMPDVENQILRELRLSNFILRQLPFYLSAGIPMTDEDFHFRDDPTLNRSF